MALDFKDISSELYREYVWPDGGVVTITGDALNVSASGGHRIIGRDGFSYYVPAGWRYLRWQVKSDAKPFDF